MNYGEDHLLEAQAALNRFYTALRGLSHAETPNTMAVDQVYEARFKSAMDDDFNTAEGIAVLFDLAREINRLKSQDLKKAQDLAHTLRTLAGVIGLLTDDPEMFLQGGSESDSESLDGATIDLLITQRLDARASKNWSEADRIRDLLLEAGVVLEDAAGGTSWRRG